MQLFKQVNLSEYSRYFADNGFVLVKDILTDEFKELLNENIAFDGVRLNDVYQFKRKHNTNNSQAFIDKTLNEIKYFYEKLIGMPLISSYAFAMNYIKGSDMLPHYDNFDNPISSTVCYYNKTCESQPILVDRAKFNNPFYRRLTIESREIPKENIEVLDVNEGDMCVFRGREHLHWRCQVNEDIDYKAILLHYMDKENTIKYDEYYPKYASYDKFLYNYSHLVE